MQDAPATQSNPAPDVKPAATAPWWLKSKTIFGVVAFVIAFLLAQFGGLQVDAEDPLVIASAQWVLAGAGLALTVAGRISAQRKIEAATLPAAPDSPISLPPLVPDAAASVLPIDPYVPQPAAVRQAPPLAGERGCVVGEALAVLALIILILLAVCFVQRRGDREPATPVLEIPARLALPAEGLPRLNVEPVVIVSTLRDR